MTVLLIIALLAGCERATGVDDERPVRMPERAHRLRCTVAVDRAAVECATSSAAGTRRAVRGSILVGGQGTYVELHASPLRRTGGDTVAVDVTLRNLMSQPIGTDGQLDSSGVVVFYQRNPEVRVGRGDVTLGPVDGTGDFSGLAQPYYRYAGVVDPDSTSAPRTWRWIVPATIREFDFEVMVAAPVPHAWSVLRWERVHGDTAAGETLYAIWERWGELFAVGANGLILHWNGEEWETQPSGTTETLRGVWGDRYGEDVFAVGNGGTILRYQGGAWAPMPSGTSANLAGVHGTSVENVYAVGTDGILRFDGTTWARECTPPTPGLTGVWAASPYDVYAVGHAGTVLHWDGAAWTAEATTMGSSLHQVWAYTYDARGVFATHGAGLLRQLPDSAPPWQPDGPPSPHVLWGVWGAYPNDVYASGHAGTMWHFDGASWRTQHTGFDVDLFGLWGDWSGDVYVVGRNRTILRGSR